MNYLKRFVVITLIIAISFSFTSIGFARFEKKPEFEKRESIFYLYGKYNFATRRVYPEFNAMLNIIDIGHAQLAERLVSAKNEEEAVKLIEEDLFEMVTKMFLGQARRPRFAPSEETVAPESSKLAWKVNKAFDWTHYLHRQVYDILADDRVKDKDQTIKEAFNYYRTEPERTFPPKLKSMELMEGQPFSGYWREKYPKFNGAIWAYHWLQLAANEVLIEPDPGVRRQKVDLAVEEFKQMFRDPSRLPKHMPMAHEVSPTFAKRYPEIAATFDNLHTFHDIYMDLLTHPKIRDKRDEAYRQLALISDPSGNLETMPSHPLPPIPFDQQQPLLQTNQMEHMAMMMMPTKEQMRFLTLSSLERKKITEKMMKNMNHGGMKNEGGEQKMDHENMDHSGK
ncbi:MAG: hypothetical protein MCM46_15950 [Candidatus Manganitrophus sp. SB1]|nr:hypothetical protein [Candidatus Manganitrophus morganii]